ncbi:hypothetical protein CDAR_17061 [Caerostris darwini]|uniref:Uncharacterized protein n=1 Tax=Caerostris darwini TaxID=1538125 RepID=A0AAV4PMV4_9ARAC|nr:hypothetical protein CDAR_17061 [Caerostris darwini]
MRFSKESDLKRHNKLLHGIESDTAIIVAGNNSGHIKDLDRRHVPKRKREEIDDKTNESTTQNLKMVILEAENLYNQLPNSVVS